MRPRKYTHRVEIWETTEVSDGFSGAVAGEGVKIGESFCNVRSLPIERQLQYGLNDHNYSAIFTLRKRNDLSYEQNGIYFIYNGREYSINRVQEKNIYEIEILASGND